jgi:hypothetical protein
MVGTYAQAAGLLTRGQLLDLVLEIEDRLRILIRSVFARTRPDWTSLIPRATREAWSQRAAPAERLPTPTWVNSPL